MSKKETPFKLKIADTVAIRKLCNKCNAIALCVIAPFTPLRIAPKRSLVASFGYPDEFVLEEFVYKIKNKYPEKETRPPLYLLIHSPGGTLSSSYMVARILRNNFNEIIGFIPHIAASGATLMALSCNQIVMGDISRLTGIDPHYTENGETRYHLSTVRAFKNLEKILGAKTLDEISYPYQHLVQSITAERYDEATHALKMVEAYTTELMKKAGYTKSDIDKVIDMLLYNIEAHEEVLPFDRAKELSLKVTHFSEDKHLSDCWKVMKEWLNKYWLQPSPIHFIRCYIPRKSKKPKKTKSKIAEQETTELKSKKKNSNK
jgi:hypothetical protein